MTAAMGVQRTGRIQNPGRAQALPPEFLSEIFLIASQGTSSGYYLWGYNWPRLPHEETVYIEPSLDTLPCTLTRVCKSWRRAALRTPTLWSQISLSLGEEGSGDMEADDRRKTNHRMVSTWLRLSRNSPLYLFISIHDHAEFPADLWESMNRWRGLRIYDYASDDYLDRHLPPSFLNETLPDRAPDLQQFQFYSKSVSAAEYLDINISKFPSLKHLSGMLNINREPITPCQLECFQASWTPKDSFRLMALSPSLTTLSLEISHLDEEWVLPSNIPPAKEVTSQIQDLRISGIGIGLVSILSCTAFPAVRNAHLTIIDDDIGYDGEATSHLQECFSYFFLECSSTLTRLNLEFQTRFEPQEDIIKTLYHATSITHLTLELWTTYDDFLHALEWCNSREDNLCPHLEYLKIYAWNYSSPDEPSQHLLLKQLVRTVRSRVEKNSSMKVHLRLQVNKTTGRVLSDSDELRSLQDEGVLQLDLV